MAGVHRYEQRQLSLDLGQEVDPHVFQIDEAGEHGEVFTRRWVVELILDLSGFTADRDLGGMVAVEPSCGSGAFLAPMTERLIESCRIHDRPLADIRTALRAFDLLPVNAELAQKTVAGALIEAGLGDTEAKSIASGLQSSAATSSSLRMVRTLRTSCWAIPRTSDWRMCHPLAALRTGVPVRRCVDGATSSSASSRWGCAS